MSSNNKNFPKESFDLKSIISTYTRHWKWFAVCLLIAFTIAFLKLRYSVPLYNSTARIQIIEDKTSTSELSAFQDLEVLSGSKNKVEDEIETIVSRSNFIQVVKTLNLNFKIETIGKVINSEVYNEAYPFILDFKDKDSVLFRQKGSFYINIVSKDKIGFSDTEDEPAKNQDFGGELKTEIGNVIIKPKSDIIEKYIGFKYKISLTPIDEAAEYFKGKVLIGQIKEKSNIVNLSIDSPNKEKGRDILNTLIMIYNQNAISNQKILADRTSEFINNRISKIYSSLTEIDSTAENFMEGRGITDIASQSNLNMNISAQSEQELQATTVQLDIAKSMVNSISNESGYGLIVSNLDNGAVQGTVSSYNQLAMQRKRLLESTGESHPDVIQLTQQMNSMKSNIVSNLKSVASNYSVRANNLSKQLAKSNSKLYSAAGNSRGLNEISRDQDNMAALYQYLIRKREEAQITAASTSPKCDVIDAAYNSSKDPVSPKKGIVYLASLILGLLFPFSIIYIKELLDNKIHNKLDLEKLVGSIPVLAEIPSLGKNPGLVKKNDRSVQAESFRILRTNIDYLIQSKNNSKKNNIVYVTSSVSGEGKTFLASNLALIFANTEKKVLLIGADIRNPKLYTFFDASEEKGNKRSKNVGLTEYLTSDINVKDIIKSTVHGETELDIIYSGKIPPNPAELLMSDKMKTLLDEVSEQYDYVIVDTAPMVVVTDTLLISKYADQLLYVTRAGSTENKVIQHPIHLKEEGKINNLSFIVNDVPESDLGYGGKYGYGYGINKKRWWHIFKK
ncbi:MULTISPECIES: GumC family protein [unclassified Cellulophaga]|uniref:GumC family protein n=1 Tax=unclassified Cellulophaga TaxID=2634405 RepID=UPI0026E3527B|nr:MULTISPECIES: tyrosine-protein kinase family protein [unclassified Cellulophaga]MDO6491490.1 polysaccharide biosynthesis tyrosine autokinase [Cellulophaga sp. 2_MG-2023]MDO6493367.1 polysaccharide biosynthesis tyrosine autokinase [Cellulophaga sp. 3_MG-2023]